MPYYEVHHSYPLTPTQKQLLATSITNLHSTTFLTPSLYVHVTYHATNASEPTYYLAGKPCTTSTNRIVAMVRTGPSRKPEHFDELAARIEESWHDVVSGDVIEQEGKDKGLRKGEVDQSETERKAKKLLAVFFYGMVAVRENGLVVPQAGGEAAWFKEYKSEFERRAENGEEEYRDLLDEVENREDLRRAYIG